MPSKENLKQIFSKDPDRYYRVALFEKLGFERRQCSECGTFFWTISGDAKLCPSCTGYSFIGNPPTKKRVGYTETWKIVEDFFVRNNHASIKRYPVVSRWRPDLYFTVASIIDFQRVEGGKVIFDFPANPLIVPQMVLRFNDVENVGVTGRHYTSFCMMGQQALSNGDGYWKDKAIELDFELLTKEMGIPKDEITFVEDVWLGYGAFGYSLEYYVRGLEMGNAVFTEFEGSPDDYRTMPNPVVDMGAGLERWAWLTNGFPSSYQSTFGPVYEEILKKSGVDPDVDALSRYYTLAGRLDIPETQDASKIKYEIASKLGMPDSFVTSQIAPLEGMFAVLDHTRTLLFAITDGALPSNVAGGYNLRVVYRRAKAILDEFGWKINVADLMRLHAENLREMYPELLESVESVITVLEVEERRYASSKSRAISLVEQLKRKGVPSEEDLIKLYDSEGITPELLKESGLEINIPTDFYKKVTARHMVERRTQENLKFDVSDIPETRLLYYEDQNLFDFSATVLRVFDSRWVALDQTAFFARSGGQEPDHGTMNGAKVIEAVKYGNVVLHRIEGEAPRERSSVTCHVDERRRSIIMRHHTATHIVNGAAKKILGPWVWQHSAFKDVSGARLDITHHSPLTQEEVTKIERLANEVVRQNIPVTLELLPRSEAERRYGFTLYQGGIVPTKLLRVQRIGDFDVEACGGTHCKRTGDIGLIKIVKAERVQDGIDRLEFVAGETALAFVEERDQTVNRLASEFATQPENLVRVVSGTKVSLDTLRKMYKNLSKRFGEELVSSLDSNSELLDGLRLMFMSNEYLDEQAHIAVGDSIVRVRPETVYVGVVTTNGRCRVIVFAGEAAISRGIMASELVKSVTGYLKGSGGGSSRLGQGGGDAPDNIDTLKDLVLKQLKSVLKAASP
ncbi:MAG: alanine--tRNA ligase [Nitrososphaerota archaeon]|nr:alanine--tRNA ligase [Nitrososphaerota archaeon]